MDEDKSCCFIGHRKIEETAELKNNLIKVVEDFIKRTTNPQKENIANKTRRTTSPKVEPKQHMNMH